jgi:hypothetical protein
MTGLMTRSPKLISKADHACLHNVSSSLYHDHLIRSDSVDASLSCHASPVTPFALGRPSQRFCPEAAAAAAATLLPKNEIMLHAKL